MPRTPPKHKTIFDLLHQQIREGRFSTANRLPSEMELAQRHGVSRPTAARAIKDLQALGLLERRAGSGTYLKRPNTADMRRPAQLTFGLLVPGLGDTEILDPICNEITQFAQAQSAEALRNDGVALTTDSSADAARRLARHYIDRGVAGIFFAPLESVDDRERINLSIIASIKAAGIAVVLLDREAPDFPSRSDCDLVGVDNFYAGLVLCQHLLSIGHRKFVFMARPHPPSTTDLRIAGCREAMARAGVAAPVNWIRLGDPTDADFVADVLQSNEPDTIICSNDRTAALLIQSLTRLGKRVPDDLAVAGFDDVRYATLLAAPLTTMRQPCRDIARAAMRCMLERIEHPNLPARQISLTTELVVRQSCGRK